MLLQWSLEWWTVNGEQNKNNGLQSAFCNLHSAILNLKSFVTGYLEEWSTGVLEYWSIGNSEDPTTFRSLSFALHPMLFFLYSTLEVVSSMLDVHSFSPHSEFPLPPSSLITGYYHGSTLIYTKKSSDYYPRFAAYCLLLTAYCLPSSVLCPLSSVFCLHFVDRRSSFVD